MWLGKPIQPFSRDRRRCSACTWWRKYDAFVSLLSADLKQPVRSTYLGGTGSDVAYSMAVSGGNIYVAGWTGSSPFPGTSGGAQPTLGGNTDAFVSLLRASQIDFDNDGKTDMRSGDLEMGIGT